MKTYTLRHSNDNAAASSELISVQMVKTKFTKPEKEIDTKDINTTDDLKAIKKHDPFAYYSIPAVRSAKVLFKDDMDVDMSNLQESGLRRNCTSCPSRMQTSRARPVKTSRNDDWEQEQQEEEPQSSSTQKVSRSTRISFECHPDLILDDLLDELYGDDDFEASVDPFAALLQQ